MTRECGSGFDERVPGEAFTEIAQQDSRDSNSASPARGQLRNAQRSRRRSGTKGLIQSQALSHGIERLAVALRLQQPINILLGEAMGISDVGPWNHPIPQPAVI